jgi:enediyne biosynthesis protein E4
MHSPRNLELLSSHLDEVFGQVKIVVLTCVAIAVLNLAGCKSRDSDSNSEIVAIAKENSPLSFSNITDKVGLQHIFDNGESADEYSILEIVGGGVGVCDFDRDGSLDLYFTTGGQLIGKKVSGLGSGGKLLRNKANQTFHDATESASAECQGFYTHGVSIGDLNNDGFCDLMVTGYSQIAFLINQGDGTFINTHPIPEPGKTLWGTSAALGDFNNDGALDAYVTQYVNWSFDNHPACEYRNSRDVCTPGVFLGLDDVVYMNSLDGSLTAKSKEIGLQPEGKGLGVLAADFDQDGWMDVYVANDAVNNFFYKNVGGRFEEVGQLNATATDELGMPQGSMGLCGVDFDNDLKLDIFVCNYENQAFCLYKNDDGSNYRCASSIAGLMALGTLNVAWGTSANDFDLDGDEDIVVSNGHVMRSVESAQQPIALVNTGNSRFVRQNFPEDNYFAKKWRGRGLVAFDFDSDGDQDVLFTNVNQNVALLSNDTVTSGKWWSIDLVGVNCNRDGIGARIIIESKKTKLLRQVNGGGSYLSQNPYTVHWGLPADDSVEKVIIYWPSGKEQVLTDLPACKRQLIIEPQS